MLRRSALCFLAFFSVFSLSSDPRLTVVGVQFNLDEFTYSSVEVFAQIVEQHVQDAVELGDDSMLIVFPEYTSVFLALIPYYEVVRRAETVAEALEYISAANASISTVHRLFASQSTRVEKVMDEVWGRLAAEYAVYLLAGTRFVLRGDELRNSLVVYAPDGGRAYEQDKVYLTDFELQVPQLQPGKVADSRPIGIAGQDVAFTICRVTFFSAWDSALGSADYWIDIKANGATFSQAEARRFLTALPERIRDTGVTRGLTVCLTGAFLDLYWEGTSFTVRQAGTEVLIPHVAESAVAGEILADVLY